MYPTIEWRDESVWMIDQRKLPLEMCMVEHKTVQQVAGSIHDMVIRGAPAIGVAAAFGLALASRQYHPISQEDFDQSYSLLYATRPTAVNLVWALDRMRKAFEQAEPGVDLNRLLLEEALRIEAEDFAVNKQMGILGASLLPQSCTVLTHCNAGALATSGYGTALGVIRAAIESGKSVSVLADETRPFLQGARLTVWELQQDEIPVTLITDNMAAAMMRSGRVDAIIVGADRVAANGDVANKIGTYGLAILAQYHGLPFYVAAPLSTIDLRTRSGEDIPIEERNSEEVLRFSGSPIAGPGTAVHNPAFDVTPAELISALITEVGICHHPCEQTIAGLFQ